MTVHRNHGMPFGLVRKPHTIDLDDMLKFIEDKSAAWNTYASDGAKRLEFRHAGGYRVTLGARVVYEGTDGRSAVNAYNEAA